MGFNSKKIQNPKLVKKDQKKVIFSTLKAWGWGQTLMDFIFFWISPSYTIIIDIPNMLRNPSPFPTPYLGMDFPYEPGDKVHFLGPKGRIGHGRILTRSGENYRIAHSGTRITSSIKKCMAPTLTTRQNYSRRTALSPHLNTIVCREQKRVKFQLGTKRASIRN